MKTAFCIISLIFFVGIENADAGGWFWGGHPPVRKAQKPRAQAFVPDNEPEERPPAKRQVRTAETQTERQRPPARVEQEPPSRQNVTRTSNDNVQEPQCYPATEEAKNWPVKAIYLHGWFEPSGNSSGYQSSEKKNMQQMKELAQRLKIRIALPRAPRTTTTKKGLRVRSWDGTSLAEIESASKNVCGAPLANDRTLIGFSNGGYRTRWIAAEICKRNSPYSKIFSFGAPKSMGRVKCPLLTEVAAHKLPSNDYFAQNIPHDRTGPSLRAPAAIRRASN